MADASNKRDPFVLERTITHRLHTLSKLTDRVSHRAYVDGADIPLSEGRCLAAIGSFSPLSVNELAFRANLNKGQASRAAQVLVEQGLVRKAMLAADRRGVVLTLTPRGRRAWARLARIIETRNEQIAMGLTAAERAQLDRLLDLLLAQARQDAESLDEGDE